MSIDSYGDGFVREAPQWITEEIEFLIKRSKLAMPKNFVLQTIENEFGLVLLIDNKHYQTFTVEDRLQILQQVQRLRDQIEATGCPVWMEKD